MSSWKPEGMAGVQRCQMDRGTRPCQKLDPASLRPLAYPCLVEHQEGIPPAAGDAGSSWEGISSSGSVTSQVGGAAGGGGSLFVCRPVLKDPSS